MSMLSRTTPAGAAARLLAAASAVIAFRSPEPAELAAPGRPHVVAPALHLLGGVWIASCPTCGYQLVTARTQDGASGERPAGPVPSAARAGSGPPAEKPY
jgi:hypothetical protein